MTLGFHGANWRMRAFLYAYRAWVLYGGSVAHYLKYYGLPIMSAYSAKKLYKRIIYRKKMSWFSRSKPVKPSPEAQKRLKRLNNRVKRLEQGFDKEMKTYDDSRSGALPDTGSGEIACISDMAQGDTSITREGLVIQPRHLEYKFVCLANSATLYQARLIIFLDTQQSGTPPTAAQLLESDVSTAWIEHDTRPRFRILRDFWLVPDTGTRAAIVKRGIIKFPKNMRIHYSGTTSGDASMAKNNLYIYCTSNTASGAPSLNLYTRLRFVDG